MTHARHIAKRLESRGKPLPDDLRSVLGSLAHNRGFSSKELGEYIRFRGPSMGISLSFEGWSSASLIRHLVAEGLIQSTTKGHYYPTEKGWRWIEGGTR